MSEEYFREQFTTKHPWTHEDDCYCDFDRGMKCLECGTNAERERWSLQTEADVVEHISRWLEKDSQSEYFWGDKDNLAQKELVSAIRNGEWK